MLTIFLPFVVLLALWLACRHIWRQEDRRLEERLRRWRGES